MDTYYIGHNMAIAVNVDMGLVHSTAIRVKRILSFPEDIVLVVAKEDYAMVDLGYRLIPSGVHTVLTTASPNIWDAWEAYIYSTYRVSSAGLINAGNIYKFLELCKDYQLNPIFALLTLIEVAGANPGYDYLHTTWLPKLTQSIPILLKKPHE